MAEMTYREALQQALREELQRDQNVFLMGEDIGVFEGAYKVTAGFYNEFGPKRVVDTPIAENSFVGAGIGAAMVGLRPIIELMTINFAVQAMDQIVNHAAKIRYMFGGAAKVPMVIRTPGGGGVQLAAQHAQTLDVWFAFVPGLKVVCPSTPADAKGMLKSAVRDDNPVMFIEHLGLYNTRGTVPDGNDHLVPLNKASVKKEGKDLTIVANSRMTLVALEAADQLQKEGIDAEVVDLRCLRPLDRQTILESVMKTSRALVLEEDWRSYGIGAEISATIGEEAFDYLDAPVKRIGGAEVPMPYSKILERAAIPNVQDVLNGARSLAR